VGTVVGVGRSVVGDAVVVTNDTWVTEPETPAPDPVMVDNLGSTTKYMPAMTTRAATAPMITIVFLDGADFFGGVTGGEDGDVTDDCAGGASGLCWCGGG